MTKFNLLTISMLIFGIVIIFFVQFATPTLYGADGYLHIRMAEFLREVSFGKTSNPYTVLKDSFKVKYGYISKNYFSELINQIKVDRRFAILAEDNFGVIFKLI